MPPHGPQPRRADRVVLQEVVGATGRGASRETAAAERRPYKARIVAQREGWKRATRWQGGRCGKQAAATQALASRARKMGPGRPSDRVEPPNFRRFTRHFHPWRPATNQPAHAACASGFGCYTAPLTAERCRSGRSGRSRKPLYLHGYREFESHPLRQLVRSPDLSSSFPVELARLRRNFRASASLRFSNESRFGIFTATVSAATNIGLISDTQRLPPR